MHLGTQWSNRADAVGAFVLIAMVLAGLAIMILSFR